MAKFIWMCLDPMPQAYGGIQGKKVVSVFTWDVVTPWAEQPPMLFLPPVSPGQDHWRVTLTESENLKKDWENSWECVTWEKDDVLSSALTPQVILPKTHSNTRNLSFFDGNKKWIYTFCIVLQPSKYGAAIASNRLCIKLTMQASGLFRLCWGCLELCFSLFSCNSAV